MEMGGGKRKAESRRRVKEGRSGQGRQRRRQGGRGGSTRPTHQLAQGGKSMVWGSEKAVGGQKSGDAGWKK